MDEGEIQKKRDVTKIQNCRIMRLVSQHIHKEKAEKSPLAKMSLLVQIAEEVKAPVCFDDSLQIARITR